MYMANKYIFAPSALPSLRFVLGFILKDIESLPQPGFWSLFDHIMVFDYVIYFILVASMILLSLSLCSYVLWITNVVKLIGSTFGFNGWLNK